METGRRLKEKRTRSGAVELEGVEVQVQLTDNKASIDDLIPKQVLVQILFSTNNRNSFNNENETNMDK